MEIALENARQYLTVLKEDGDFTYEDIANISGVPLSTVHNIFSGKTAKNAGFGTVAKLVISMGGDLNGLVGNEKKREIEINSTVSLKETYEMRIADLIKAYETRIEDIKNLCELRIEDVQKCCDCRISDLRRNYEERLAEQKGLSAK